MIKIIKGGCDLMARKLKNGKVIASFAKICFFGMVLVRGGREGRRRTTTTAKTTYRCINKKQTYIHIHIQI